ncbi:hypothetical protein FUA23_11835 [Neolewinella aurantiaca]|uniref:Uncharacterized protein n=1 Tax=Neolewinella aurantiaca TaxID=2602767 RepID=A0A5C7FUR2_9BACT|nr:hypothetical protein [Neolewinella aurantiaca]TXF89195.1 hypothetical protein FUA23_11835 [Neolewinella aurantiaca]
MLKYLPLLLIFTLFSACEGNTAARKAARGENFVSDPDHLYFKNIRARHYAGEEVAQRATIFRHDALFISDANLRPVLIDNWLQDRAIIRFELAKTDSEWQLQSVVEGEGSDVELSVPPTNEELNVLRELLLGKGDLLLVLPGDTLSAFPEASGRQAAREVLNDYLRMVGFEG